MPARAGNYHAVAAILWPMASARAGTLTTAGAVYNGTRASTSCPIASRSKPRSPYTYPYRYSIPIYTGSIYYRAATALAR
ncbi:hypothetical protein [Sphingobacterium tabacisoli]|uniref:Secreted protein n=1 Tax=Sphingobacterium tabacisoli TaxID=2044855 RepID=A0ABW5L4E2_9SPHI|nr:hypothetical protein [Sphingobacterium tabacisoli]